MFHPHNASTNSTQSSSTYATCPGQQTHSYVPLPYEKRLSTYNYRSTHSTSPQKTSYTRRTMKPRLTLTVSGTADPIPFTSAGIYSGTIAPFYQLPINNYEWDEVEGTGRGTVRVPPPDTINVMQCQHCSAITPIAEDNTFISPCAQCGGAELKPIQMVIQKDGSA